MKVLLSYNPTDNPLVKLVPLIVALTRIVPVFVIVTSPVPITPVSVCTLAINE